MSAAPSILLIDDGELDRVQALVQHLELDSRRCQGPGSDELLQRPRDLLLTSAPRAMRMPELSGSGDPVWVCIYDQDFLPLRDRLRDLGVHYLVSGELGARAFELFLHQILHQGRDDRRLLRRIPLRAEIQIEVGFERRKAVLLELCLESCVVATAREVPAERRVVVHMPASLTGNGPLDIEGRVLRAAGQTAPAGRGGATTVVRFVELAAEAMLRIQQVLTGNAPGTQVTPLSPEPGALERDAWDGAEIRRGRCLDERFEESPGPVERRIDPRHDFGSRVDAIHWPGQSTPRAALARDLSLGGLRIAIEPLPEVGAELSLAIYAGAAREEPLLVDARVVRAADGEAGLAFGDLSPDQQQRLSRYLEAQPKMECLDAGWGALHLAEFVAR